MSPKRIKSMGAQGWKGKLGGDTWGPMTLLPPLLPICMEKMFLTLQEKDYGAILFGPICIWFTIFKQNMRKGESGREWNPWGRRVGKPNWGVTPRDPRLYCYPCLLSAWCFSLGHFERLRFNFVWGRMHLNPKKIKSSGAGRLGGSGWWVV